MDEPDAAVARGFRTGAPRSHRAGERAGGRAEGRRGRRRVTAGLVATWAAVSAVAGAGGARAEGPASGPSPLPADGVVSLVGSGFGHGVGMSQYGARGMAARGASASEILRHYYSGTAVAARTDAVDLRVNVVDRGTRVTLRAAALADGGGALRLLPAGGAPVDLAPGDGAVVTPREGGVAVTVTRAGGASSSFTAPSVGVRWSGGRGMAGPASVLRVDSRTAASSSVKTRRYRWGSLDLVPVRRTDPDGAVRTRIEGNLLVGLHGEYLRGVAEVPSSWPDAALQAQVVAARNYALAQATRSPAGCGGCNLWDDTRSQTYLGWDGESVAPRWTRAVTATQTSATSGLTVLYRGAPITAYYSSSTGGSTRDAAAVWGTAVPYLRAVDDRWSTDPAVNPRYASWRRTVTVRSVARAFGLRDLVTLAVTGRDASGAVTELRATASDGTSRTLRGSALTGSAFGLPAAWVTSIGLPAVPPAAAAARRR